MAQRARIDVDGATTPVRTRKAGMSQGAKLLIALVLLLGAAAALAWNLGLFSQGKDVTQEQQQPVRSGGRGMAPDAKK